MGHSLSPVARIVARIAARTDFTAAALLEDVPQWPVLSSAHEMEDRESLVSLGNINHDTIEWALASFEIDNLWHRAYRFAKQSHIYRTSSDPRAEEKIQGEYNTIMEGLERWKRRDIVVSQEELERLARQTIATVARSILPIFMA